MEHVWSSGIADYSALIVALATLIASVTASVVSVMGIVRLGVVKADVAAVKHETNSMKDALVEATGKAREAKGRDDMRTEIAAGPTVITTDQIITDKIVTK